MPKSSIYGSAIEDIIDSVFTFHGDTDLVAISPQTTLGDLLKRELWYVWQAGHLYFCSNDIEAVRTGCSLSCQRVIQRHMAIRAFFPAAPNRGAATGAVNYQPHIEIHMYFIMFILRSWPPGLLQLRSQIVFAFRDLLGRYKPFCCRVWRSLVN